MHERIVVTGGAGAGKSTLLDALRRRGYIVVNETARAIIRDRRARGLSPRPEPLEFAQQILRNEVTNYDRQASATACSFFDRSILDALCMLDHAAPLTSDELNAWVSKYRYHRRVFFLPPWEAIYTTDAERDQTFEDAIRGHDALHAWYRRCGYEPVEVPKVSVDERCAYVLRILGLAAA